MQSCVAATVGRPRWVNTGGQPIVLSRCHGTLTAIRALFPSTNCPHTTAPTLPSGLPLFLAPSRPHTPAHILPHLHTSTHPPRPRVLSYPGHFHLIPYPLRARPLLPSHPYPQRIHPPQIHHLRPMV